MTGIAISYKSTPVLPFASPKTSSDRTEQKFQPWPWFTGSDWYIRADYYNVGSWGFIQSSVQSTRHRIRAFRLFFTLHIVVRSVFRDRHGEKSVKKTILEKCASHDLAKFLSHLHLLIVIKSASLTSATWDHLLSLKLTVHYTLEFFPRHKNEKKRRHSQKEMVLSSSFLSVQLQYCTLLRDAKKNLRQHSVLDWSPTSILSGPCDACLRGSDETRKVHRGMAADNIQELLMWTYTPQTQYPSLAQPLASLATLPIHDSRGSSKSLEWWPSDRTDQIRLDSVVGFGRAGPSS